MSYIRANITFIAQGLCRLRVMPSRPGEDVKILIQAVNTQTHAYVSILKQSNTVYKINCKDCR